MSELSKNSTVSLVGGGSATIVKEIGRGGQGHSLSCHSEWRAKSLKMVS